MSDKMFSALSRFGLLLALVLVAWTGARLTWQILEPMPQLPVQAQAAGAATPQRQENYAQTILSSHLFGRPETVVQPVKSAPVSKINLRLFGVLATGEENGVAMIGRNSGSLKLYRVGDRLPGAARLLEIHADHVLIKSNGRDEMLLLKPDKSLIKVMPGTDAAINTPLTSVETKTSAAGLSQLRAQILEQPEQIQQFMTFQPVEREGALIGYAISPMPSFEETFRRLGLRRGDVVTMLNGVALDSVDASMSALLELGDAPALSMVIERNGQQINIEKPFD